jgi:type II restriction enzyme
MQSRDFIEWLNTFKTSISDYKYYVDFEKVHYEVECYKVELNILNSLIGSVDIENDFLTLLTKYPEVLKVIPTLLAIRRREIMAVDNEGEFNYNFDKPNLSNKQYAVFMRKTGLFDLLSNHIVNNLVDYATGVETGLNSSGRKNRGGHLMENLVEGYLQSAGFVKDETYFKEMRLSEVSSRWGIDLSAISNDGKTEKRFDFIVKTDTNAYLIEVNFYASSGSKLNETARSYKNLAQESKNIEGAKFVWFTDGQGWFNAKHNLEETFEVLEHIYNLNDLENGIVEKVMR